MSRRASRRHSFIVTYQLQFYAQPEIAQVLELYAQAFADSDGKAGFSAADNGFIQEQVYGIQERLEHLDGIIRQYITAGWSMARIAKVDLAILRLAVYELAYMPDIPTRVCINEAVELAKTYGDDDAPAFVNGLLASAQRKIRPEKAPEEANEQ